MNGRTGILLPRELLGRLCEQVTIRDNAVTAEEQAASQMEIIILLDQLELLDGGES
ncbi:hypothetical protein [Bifidobacterium dentium]|uniref:hypothetical protein n=1 Tax=Bifidobacterium dentium TaxID=1689 RepID=UPI00206EDE88|nr:MAG TPA: hypothetical protein [Caudoviricetes sp.]